MLFKSPEEVNRCAFKGRYQFLCRRCSDPPQHSMPVYEVTPRLINCADRLCVTGWILMGRCASYQYVCAFRVEIDWPVCRAEKGWDAVRHKIKAHEDVQVHSHGSRNQRREAEQLNSTLQVQNEAALQRCKQGRVVSYRGRRNGASEAGRQC